MTGTSKPTCPCCGSHNIGFPGVATFHYSRGKWRVIKGSVTINESADCFHCGDCGAILDSHSQDTFSPPFDFRVQPNESFYSTKERTRTMVNLATDPAAQAAYDEPGSWGRMSEGWPETPYTPAKFLLCTKTGIVPYGQYVVVGVERVDHRGGGWWDRSYHYDYTNAVIRVADERLLAKLEEIHHQMFIECRDFIESELAWDEVKANQPQ